MFNRRIHQFVCLHKVILLIVEYSVGCFTWMNELIVSLSEHGKIQLNSPWKIHFSNSCKSFNSSSVCTQRDYSSKVSWSWGDYTDMTRVSTPRRGLLRISKAARICYTIEVWTHRKFYWSEATKNNTTLFLTFIESSILR